MFSISMYFVVSIHEASTHALNIFSISFFEGCFFHFLCFTLLEVSFSGPLATLRSRKIKEIERSVNIWTRQRSFV